MDYWGRMRLSAVTNPEEKNVQAALTWADSRHDPGVNKLLIWRSALTENVHTSKPLNVTRERNHVMSVRQRFDNCEASQPWVIGRGQNLWRNALPCNATEDARGHEGRWWMEGDQPEGAEENVEEELKPPPELKPVVDGRWAAQCGRKSATRRDAGPGSAWRQRPQVDEQIRSEGDLVHLE